MLKKKHNKDMKHLVEYASRWSENTKNMVRPLAKIYSILKHTPQYSNLFYTFDGRKSVFLF